MRSLVCRADSIFCRSVTWPGSGAFCENATPGASKKKQRIAQRRNARLRRPGTRVRLESIGRTHHAAEIIPSRLYGSRSILKLVSHGCCRDFPVFSAVGQVAKAAKVRKIRAFAGICRLKSTRLWASSAQQAATAPRCKAKSNRLPARAMRRQAPRSRSARKHSAYDSADNAGLREALDVIVVGMADDRSIVESLVSGKNLLERARAPSPLRGDPGKFARSRAASRRAALR